MTFSVPERQLSFELNMKQVNTLVIENEDVMSEIVEALHLQLNGGNGKLILSDADKELKLSSAMAVITDPFDLNINNRQIIKNLYTRLQNTGNDEQEILSDINARAVNFLDEITIKSGIDNVIYDIDPSIETLLKMYNVRFDTDYINIVERISAYIKTCVDICGIRIFCGINLKSYFSPARIGELFSMMKYYKAVLFLIEARERMECCEEKCYIIDRDQCIIAK